MQTLVCCSLVACLAGRSHRKGIIDKLHRALLRLLHIAPAQAVREVQKAFQSSGAAHQQVTQMFPYGRDEILRIEAFCKNLVQKQEGTLVVALQRCVHYLEIVLVIENVEVAYDILIMNFRPAESHGLVENREGVTHRSVRLARNHVQGLIVNGNILLCRDGAKVHHYVRHADTVEIIGLAA